MTTRYFHKSVFFSLAVLFLGLLACEEEREQISTDASIRLSFSEDTVFFDTVFTSLGSITKRISVINSAKNAVNIDRISIGNQLNSPYSLIINGKEQNSLENIHLRGDDSLLVLVKVTIDPLDQDLPFVVKDSVVFETNGNLQDVKLMSWGQDANFYRTAANRTDLECQTVWTADRPYVVFDSLVVRPGCELIIEAGAKVHFDISAALYVLGKITVLGSPENPVIFQGIRQDEPYDVTPAQWLAIFLLEGSKDNTIDWAIIKNAQIGLRVGTPDEDDEPDVRVTNTIIENMAISGIQSFTSDIYLANTLITNCADNGISMIAGGNYTIHHCTIVNYQLDFLRSNLSLLMTNIFPLEDQDDLVAPLNVDMRNTIVWGSFREELEFIAAEDESIPFNIRFENNVIRTEFTEEFGQLNFVNIDPKFRGSIADRIFFLDEGSPAIDAGQDLGILRDLLDAERTETPDIGAYEYFEAEEEGN